MPTYEYECTKCAHLFEAYQSMVDAPLKKCPKCSGKVKRLIGTGAGILFKGKGFYQTDYRSTAYHSSAKADSASSSASASTSSTSSSSSASTTTPAAPATTAAPATATKPSGGKKKR